MASLPVVLSGSFFLHTPHSHVCVWMEQLPRCEEGPGCQHSWMSPHSRKTLVQHRSPPVDQRGMLLALLQPRPWRVSLCLTRLSVFPGQ